MKHNTVILLLLIACGVFMNVEEVRSDQTVDYEKIFSGGTWSRSKAFMDWARPLTIQNSEKTKCSDRTVRRLAGSREYVLFCQQVAKLNIDGEDEPAELVWAIVRRTTPSPYGHDCNAGLTFLDKKRAITEDNPADCAYSLAIEDPADTPIMVFIIKTTGEIGVVFDGHGTECGGRAVLKQEEHSFKRVHELRWTCEQ